MPGLRHWLQRKLHHPRRSPKERKEEGQRIPAGLPILPSSYRDLHFLPSPSPSPFFHKLPPEIRHAIYLAAFGARTLHIDLQYNHPDVPGPWHARLSGKQDAVDLSAPVAWRWWSCVCHRNPLIAEDLFLDNCRIGAGWCNYRYEGNGKWGHVDKTGPRDDCFVGVMGWMMSCRQAYMEAHDVLYSTNTLFIHSVPLTNYISSLLPLRNLAMMTSLEFMWDIDSSPNALLPWIHGEDGDREVKRWKLYKYLVSLVDKSTFPNLQKLAIVAVDYGDGVEWVPNKITAVSNANPHQVPLLDPTDQIVADFDGQLQEFELTLPYDRAADLKEKVGQNMKVIRSGAGCATRQKFWRAVPGGLGGERELGYWIFWGMCNAIADQVML